MRFINSDKFYILVRDRLNNIIENRMSKLIKLTLIFFIILNIFTDIFIDENFVMSIFLILSIYYFYVYGIKNYKTNQFLIKIGISYFIALRLFLIDKSDIDTFSKPKVIFVIIVLIVIYFINDRSEDLIKESSEDLPILTKERKNDLDRLKSYVFQSNTNIIGLNGRWGTGKSLLIEHLKQDLNNKYFFIEIDVLSSNSNETQIILMNEINKILRQNKIFSNYSPKLRSFFENEGILKNIQNQFFYDDTIFINMIKGVKQEINQLNKPLLIIYEDLDRINDFEIIQKILGVSEKLASKGIKIIYQYSRNNMAYIDLEKRLTEEYLEAYLEKYIPYNINLTDIELYSLIEFKLNLEKKYDKHITIEDIIGVLRVSKSININDVSIDVRADFKPHLINMRRVEKFLDEVYFYLEGNKEDKEYEILKRTTIIFYLIQYFIPIAYKDIKINQDIEEIFDFKHKGENYTLNQLYNNEEMVLEEVFEWDRNSKEKQNNLLNLWIMGSLEYKIPRDYKNEDMKVSQTNKNSKINSRFKNLYAAGLSQYTNYEIGAKKLIDEVLSEDENLWKERYIKYQDDLDKGDSQTIFYIGVSPIISLSKAFNVINANQEEWLKLLEFIEKIYKDRIQEINIEMFETFSYLNLEDININQKVGQIISSANVIGNLNRDENFTRFLKRYYRNWNGFTIIGDIEILQYEKINLEEIKSREYIIKILENHILDLEAYVSRKVVKILDNKDEIELNIKVTEKLIDIIQSKKSVKSRNPFKMDFRSEEPKEKKELRELFFENQTSEFKDKVKEFYYSNKINKGQLKYWLDEFENKNKSN